METINKLQAIEHEIKAEVAKAKSNKALADKVYGVKGTKRDMVHHEWPMPIKQLAKVATSNTKVYAGT